MMARTTEPLNENRCEGTYIGNIQSVSEESIDNGITAPY
jgi:hypothetical protein